MIKLPGKRKGRRPKRRFMEALTEDTHVVGVKKKGAKDRGIFIMATNRKRKRKKKEYDCYMHRLHRVTWSRP